jgi:single-strand DNA-binding protein
LKSLPSGSQVTNFSVATNRFYTASNGEKKQEAEFHNVVCFGKLADISSRYLTKGGLVLIEGRIQTRSWVNTQGVKQYRTEIIAESLQLGPKGNGAVAGSGSSNSSYSRQSAQSPEPEMQRQEDIPIIEENYTPSAKDIEDDQRTVSFEGDAADEIDVKDIPF